MIQAGRLAYAVMSTPDMDRQIGYYCDILALVLTSRNAKRRDDLSYAKAIDDWEGDLVFLRDRYYFALFHFGWPTTESLH